MAKHFFDSILFNMADMGWVVLVQVTVNAPLVRVKLLRAISGNPDPYSYSYSCLCERSLNRVLTQPFINKIWYISQIKKNQQKYLYGLIHIRLTFSGHVTTVKVGVAKKGRCHCKSRLSRERPCSARSERQAWAIQNTLVPRHYRKMWDPHSDTLSLTGRPEYVWRQLIEQALKHWALQQLLNWRDDTELRCRRRVTKLDCVRDDRRDVFIRDVFIECSKWTHLNTATAAAAEISETGLNEKMSLAKANKLSTNSRPTAVD